MKSFDVLGLGVCSVDDLLYVDAYPPANGKQRVMRRERACGGLTANALVAAQRLGGCCAFAGQLGHDAQSELVLATLAQHGVDTQHVLRDDEAQPVQSTIIISNSGRDRAIFPFRPPKYGAPDAWPEAAVIERARVLFVDHMGAAGQLRAAKIARAAGIPVVSDLERDESPHFDALLAQVDHAIFSHEFACQRSGKLDPVEAALALSLGRPITIVTIGEQGSVVVAGDTQRVMRYGTLKIDHVVDTTGCGDVFHGAYAFALAQGWPLERRIQVASHAAALKATRSGGQSGPSWDELARTLD